MNNVIQQLKDNEKPFILMSEEMQEWMLTVEKPEDIEHMVCRVNLTIDWFSMSIRLDKGNCKHMEGTYRLRADYEDEPEIVECEIKPDDQGWFKFKMRDGELAQFIHCAVNHPDFIGFKFLSGQVELTPIVFKGSCSTKSICQFRDLAELKVLHASHVLFRRKKQE